MESVVNVIHQDEELLIINKPADLVCHPTKAGAYSSLIGRVRLHLGPAARPHLVNRLDRETSGVVVVALQDNTARALRRVWETRQVEKEYLAIVCGHVLEDHGRINAKLGKDERSPVAIKDCVRPDGAEADTEFWVEKRFARAEGPFTLLKVVPHTGRKHQIRIHLAYMGHPIVGDKLYGGNEELYLALVEKRLTPEDRRSLLLPYHALHAAAVRFPWRDRLLRFAAAPEPWFLRFANGD